MIRLEINDTAVNRALDELSQKLDDMTPLMTGIGEFLTTSTKDRFETGRAPDGTPWAPKSPVTLAAYARRNEPVDNRPLFGPSLALQSQVHSAATRDSVEWGSSMKYAGTMQFGAAQGEFGSFFGMDKNGRSFFTQTPWGDIPARPFVGLSQGDETGILDMVGEYLTDDPS